MGAACIRKCEKLNMDGEHAGGLAVCLAACVSRCMHVKHHSCSWSDVVGKCFGRGSRHKSGQQDSCRRFSKEAVEEMDLLFQ